MSTYLPNLPPRPADGHKGTFGSVCVLGGSAVLPQVMLGGPCISAVAALRSGCGLAVLALPEPLLTAGLTIAPSATGLALPVDQQNYLQPSAVAEILDQHIAGDDCLAIGPGMGTGQPQQQIVVRLINQQEQPLVIDADALNCLAALRNFSGDFRCHAVLTPHPGEYKRLAESLQIDADPIDPHKRPDAAEQLARRLGCVVVLKGHGTVVSDGVNTWTCQAGNPALGTGGTGDSLTGLIAGMIGQFFKPSLGMGSRQVSAKQQGGMSLYDCARLGVEIGSRAADRWAAQHGQAGMVVMDMLEHVPDVLAELRGKLDGSS